MLQLADVAGNDQDFVGLKFHERIRRYKSVHGYSGPTNFLQDTVHPVHGRDLVYGNTGLLQPINIAFMGYLAKIVHIFPASRSATPLD